MSAPMPEVAESIRDLIEDVADGSMSPRKALDALRSIKDTVFDTAALVCRHEEQLERLVMADTMASSEAWHTRDDTCGAQVA